VGNIEITVVIPTFQRPESVRMAIKSAQQAARGLSDEESLEIIVVDDGHCETTRKTCSEAQRGLSSSIEYLTTSRIGSGPAAARNIGVAAAKGAYIYFLDDDDQFLPNRFERSLPLLRTGICDAVLERTNRVFADGSNRPSYISGPNGCSPSGAIETIEYLISGGKTAHITPGATSFSKEIFIRLGGQNERLRFGEDGEFLLRLGAFARVAFLGGEPVATYFFHPRNSSRSDNLHYHQNIKSLGHFYKSVRGAEAGVRIFVKRLMGQKLDFVLTRYRQESPTYFMRLTGGTRALRFYSWDCLTWNNVKSIAAWLIKRRTA